MNKLPKLRQQTFCFVVEVEVLKAFFGSYTKGLVVLPSNLSVELFKFSWRNKKTIMYFFYRDMF